MPESRRRKPKNKNRGSTSGTKPTVPERKGHIGKIITILVTAFTLFAGAVVFWPRVTTEPTAAADKSNPLSGYFRVTNTQFYPLEDVRIEAILWCTKVGLGTNTSPIDRCEPAMPSSKHQWNKRTLQGDESYDIPLGDVLYVTPSALLYAEISIRTSYTPWIVPIHLSKEFRFYTHRKDDGQIEWLHKPLEG